MQASKKEKLLRTIGFFLTLIAVLSILNFVFNPLRLDMVKYVTEHDSYYLSLMQEPEDTIDVLIMGDSLSYGMINPMDFWEEKGITSYIAGQAGQVVPETYFELYNIVKNQSPKVILLETGILTHDVETELHILVYQIMYDFLPATKYHELWKVMLGDKDQKTKPHFKGFEIRDVIAGYSGEEYMIPTDGVFRIRPLSKLYLEKIKSLCDEHDIELILVSMPSPKNYNYKKHNGIKKISDELGIKYIDFNLMTDELSFDWNTDMLDYNDHVNINGTAKTSDYLLNYIIENYDIKSRADGELADKWNKELKDFKEKFGLD